MRLRAQELSTDSIAGDTSNYGVADPDSLSVVNWEDVSSERTVVYNSTAPDSAQWQQATSDKGYAYRDAKEYEGKEEKQPDTPWLLKIIYAVFRFFASPLGRFILWGALIAIVGYVIYHLLRQGGIFNARDRKADVADEGGELSEESLLEQDWEGRMREALQAGDARAAIRYSYLRLLQLLQQRELISYRPDKTNIDYYRELADKPQRQDFRTIMRQYEWAWYGNIIPEKAAMDSYLQTFGSLKSSLAD